MKIVEYIKFIRPLNWRAYLLMGIFGLLILKFIPPIKSLLWFLLSLMFYLAFSFSINNYFDVEEDKHDKKSKNPLAKNKINFLEARIIIIISAILAVLFSSLLGLNATIYMLLMLLLSALYSAKPFKLKGRFLLDIISHSLFFGVMIFLYPSIAFNFNLGKTAIFLSILIAYISIELELRNHYEDYEHDKKAGLKTTVVKLGKQNTEKTIIFMNLLYPLLFLSFWFILFGSKLMLPLIIMSALYYISIYVYKKKFRIFDIFTNLTFLIFLLILYSV